MDFNLNLNNKRAREARRSNLLKDSWLRSVFNILAVSVLFLAGYLLTAEESSLGYLLLIPVVMWMILYSYYSLHLKELKIISNPKEITDLLEQDLLANLHTNDLNGLLSALEKSFGGRFLATRFSISPKTIWIMLESQGSSKISLSSVLEKAYNISLTQSKSQSLASIDQQKVNSNPNLNKVSLVKSIYIAVALLDVVEESMRTQVLASIGLSDDDLSHAIEWFDHFEGLVKKSKLKNKNGGLGRDLSFGYTPLLSSFAVNMSDSIDRSGNIYRELEGNKQVLDNMMHVLSSASRLNAGLIGRVGIGKTNLVWNLAEKLLYPDASVPQDLKYKQIFKIEASTLIANSQGNGRLEDLLIRIFNEAFRAKNVIIFLDDAELFLENGAGKIDLSGVLSQVLEAGGNQLILAMSDQAWLRLSNNNPSLAGLINRINLIEVSSDEAMHVAQDQVLILEGRLKVRYLYQTIKRAVELAERFISDEASPGKVIKLLEYGATYAKDGWVTTQSIEEAVEKNFGVKIQSATNVGQAETDKLLNLEDLIHERMINQSRAVKIVSDALRRSRAGVRNTKKPVGTFLFIGPTGVGKTELAKSLAATYFGGEDDLIRVDMNEFSQASDVSRLLAPASENSSSLTAQISKKPFSVVLLDELEKAHPNVLNVLLQMLDEGILRDSSNKEVSFRESIIIATSNAGAQFINDYMQKNGVEAEAMKNLEETLLKELINQGTFKPEFVNRFDEVATFRSLNEEELVQVVKLIMNGVNKSLANQKLQVNLKDGAAELLVKEGNDPLLGARPMRRIVQKTVENIVAERILRGEARPGVVIELSAEDIKNHL